MEMLLQEKQALDTYSGQRDAILNELSVLTKERDSLLSYNKELVYSITVTQGDLDAINEVMKAQLKGEGAVSEQVKATINALKQSVEFIKKEKDQVTLELNERTSFLRDISSEVDKMAREVEQTKNALQGIYTDIHNAAMWMKEAVVEIQQIVFVTRDNSKKFTEDFTAYEKTASERLLFLDNKEKLITARERAVDDKYLSYVNKAQADLN